MISKKISGLSGNHGMPPQVNVLAANIDGPGLVLRIQMVERKD